MLTLGQYLPPAVAGERYLPVGRFVPPEQFAKWAGEARGLGFRAVAAGPLVRSSYRAGSLLDQARGKLKQPK
jgi:lipoic acid synthetase